METLKRSATALTERRFDAIHLHGPGTDLTVGLFRSSIWHAAEFTTIDDLAHYPNIPSEETFTTPDPLRVDGHVSATLPLELYGSIIRGLRVEFEGGRAVKIDADENAETLRAACTKDDGASRLGELALVDGARPDRPAADRVLRHAARRERREPHRARLGLLDGGRRRGRTSSASTRARSTSTS